MYYRKPHMHMLPRGTADHGDGNSSLNSGFKTEEINPLEIWCPVTDKSVVHVPNDVHAIVVPSIGLPLNSLGVQTCMKSPVCPQAREAEAYM